MDLHNIKVLFVDDEEDIREYYELEFGPNFAQFLKAENGLKALEILEQEKGVDLLITDMAMPEMDGLELLAEVRKRYPFLVTMILTSSNEYEVMSKAIELGVHDFINKSYKINMIRHRIQKVIEFVKLERKRNEILEYLLESMTNHSIENYRSMNAVQQFEVLEAVQAIVSVKNEMKVLKKNRSI